MPTISTNSSTMKEVTLQSLNDDVIWAILSYLPLTDVLMVADAVPEWNHVTSDLLFKQQFASCGIEYRRRQPSRDPYDWFDYDKIGWCDLRSSQRCFHGYRQSDNKDSIRKQWLHNESLTEWKLLLERCPNLSSLHLYELGHIGAAQLISILQCICRLCKNLKSFVMQYDPLYLNTGKVVKIDMAKEQYMFNWIPSWGYGGEKQEKEIVLTPKLLESSSKINNWVLDYVQAILAKVRPYIRDPYWFSLTFQRRTVNDEGVDTGLAVARLQCITLGICEYKNTRERVLERMDTFTCYGYRMEFQNKLDVFPQCIETICSQLKPLKTYDDLARSLYSLELFEDTDDVYVEELEEGLLVFDGKDLS